MKRLITIAAIALLGLNALAASSIVPATIQEMAKYGATHVLEWDHEDLTSTSTNDTHTFTNTFTGPVSVKFEGYILDTPFDSSTVTNPTALTVSVGDTSSATKWISALQVAYDQTPTYYSSFGTDYSGTAAMTYTVATNAFITSIVDATTNTEYAITEITGIGAAITITSPWINAQTGDVSVVTTIAMTGETVKMSDLNSGLIRLFFRALGPKYDR
jgi:hypothetical protein